MNDPDTCSHEWLFIKRMMDPNHPSPHVRTAWKCRACGTVAVTEGMYPLNGRLVREGEE